MRRRRTRVKFCGMTRLEDALAAAALGVDAIGVVLTLRSRRFAGVDRAREIFRALPPFVTRVALFMDDEPAFVADAVASVSPHLLQFHGSETAADCVRYGKPYLKSVAMGAPGRSPSASEAMDGRERPTGRSPSATGRSPSATKAMDGREWPSEAMDGRERPGEDWRTVVAAHPQAAGFLFDGHAAGEAGGSGRRFDWSVLPAQIGRPIILAGGLDSDNVGTAVRQVRPFAVDVSSGIESELGIKDENRMRRFIAAVNEADEED